MEVDILRTYKAAVFANVSKANRTAKFSRVLAAIDYAPVVTMLLTAAVLSVICIAVYVILATKYPVIWEITVRCFYTAYEVLWLNEGTRYMNFALLATCVFTGFACGKAGFPYWLFYISLFAMVAYMVLRFIKYRSTYRYVSPDDLEDVLVERARRTRRSRSEDEPAQGPPQEQQPQRQPSTRRTRRRSHYY